MATITLTKAQVEEIYFAMRHTIGGILPYNAPVHICSDAITPNTAPYVVVATPREHLTITSDGRIIS